MIPQLLTFTFLWKNVIRIFHPWKWSFFGRSKWLILSGRRMWTFTITQTQSLCWKSGWCQKLRNHFIKSFYVHENMKKAEANAQNAKTSSIFLFFPPGLRISLTNENQCYTFWKKLQSRGFQRAEKGPFWDMIFKNRFSGWERLVIWQYTQRLSILAYHQLLPLRKSIFQNHISK